MSLFAMLTAMSLSGSDGIICTFAGDAPADPVVGVTLEPVPSLKDRPGLYRVMMEIGPDRVRGNARPIEGTVEADVMIRGKSRTATYYTIGLREDGAAAMYVSMSDTGRTLIGRCQQHERWFPTWLGSETARTETRPETGSARD